MRRKNVLCINVIIITLIFYVQVVHSQEFQQKSSDSASATLEFLIKDFKVTTAKQKTWSGLKFDDNVFKFKHVFSSMSPKKGYCFGLLKLEIHNKVLHEDTLFYKNISITGKDGSPLPFQTLLDFTGITEEPIKAYSGSAVSQQLKPQSVDTLDILISFPRKLQSLQIKYKENPPIKIPVNANVKTK